MILKNMGPKWFYHRLLHSFKIKSKYYSYIEKRYADVEDDLDIDKTIDTLSQFKLNNTINSNLMNELSEIEKENIIISADRILDNQFEYFFSDVFQFDKVNWHLNPYNNKQQDSNAKWYDIPMHSLDNGDVKDYWELSRFVYTYNLINAYQLTKDKKYAEKFIELVLDWIENNQFERGVNFKCSQETSFRCINWLMGVLHLDIIQHHPKESKIILKSIFKQSFHVKELMPYSVNCVKNNHTLNEALFLYIIGSYFSFERSQEFYLKGVTVFNNSLKDQILSDGSYIQNSHTYHRVMLLSTVMFKYFEFARGDLNVTSLNLISRATEFFKHFILENGDVPNYGPNDGSIPFDFLNGPYREFRVCVDLVHKVFWGNQYYACNKKHINAWFSNDAYSTSESVTSVSNESMYFKNGGYIILKNKDKKLFIRVKDGKRRPGQSDNNTIDLWKGNKNLIIDTGTYKYTTESNIVDYFKGSTAHNFLRINEQEPMKRISQFMYSNWSKSYLESIDKDLSLVKIKNIDYENFHVVRSIELNDEMNVTDYIKPTSKETYLVEFFYHFTEAPLINYQNDTEIIFDFENGDSIKFKSNECLEYNIFNGNENPFLGWKSTHYNKLESSPQIVIKIKSNNDIYLNTKYIFKR